jgi:hypothetical protein
MSFLKKYGWIIAVVVLVYLFRTQIGTAIYSATGGKVKLFGVTGGSV